MRWRKDLVNADNPDLVKIVTPREVVCDFATWGCLYEFGVSDSLRPAPMVCRILELDKCPYIFDNFPVSKYDIMEAYVEWRIKKYLDEKG